MNKETKKNEEKTSKPKIAAGITPSDLKSFLEKFRLDVVRKREVYRLYHQKWSYAVFMRNDTESKKKISKPEIAVRITPSDLKSFLEKFRSDVARKREAYQLYRQKWSYTVFMQKDKMTEG